MRIRNGTCALLIVGLMISGCNNSSSSSTATGTSSRSIPVLPADIANDGNGIFMNIVPPGSNGNANGNPQGQGSAENFDDQLQLYEALSFAPEGLGAATCVSPKDIDEHVNGDPKSACNYFKHAGLVPDRVDEEYSITNPATGNAVTIQRDGWGVPFVTADDRQDAMFGVGYVSAQDRLFLHDVLRHVGRGQLSEFLGPEDSFFAFDVDIANVAGYSEEEMDAMVERTRNLFGAKEGELGDLMVKDIDSMVAGINQYLGDLQTSRQDEIPQEYASLTLPNAVYPPRPWNRNDIVASAILIQSIFAVGGGGEHRNLLQLMQSDPSLSPENRSISQAACELWRDLRHANDPDTPQTSELSFPTQSGLAIDETCPQAGKPLPASVAVWDRGSFQTRQALKVTDTGIPVAAPLTPDAVPIDLGGSLPQSAGSGGSDPGGQCAPDEIPGIGGECLPSSTAPTSTSGSSCPAGEIPGLDGLCTSLAQLAENPEMIAALTKTPSVSMLTGSLDPLQGARDNLCKSGLCLPNTLSNFIGVPASQTEDRFPIAVMGPQAGYFLAQLLWEVAVVSGGDHPGPLDFAGRGVIFADLPYINIGRGLDYAWSATSGSSDLVDVRVSRMCNLPGNNATPSRSDADGDGFPDADGYWFRGACRPFDKRSDEWLSSPTVASVASGGSPTLHQVERLVMRTHYGPVFATATVGGEPVAVSLQRSTFFGELDTAPPFALASTRSVSSFDDFRKLFNSATGTFNWLYTDAKDIAWFHSGLYPKRNSGHHQELPTWGEGDYEWQSMDQYLDTLAADSTQALSQYFSAPPYANPATTAAQGANQTGYFEWPGYLSLAEHPQEKNPDKGYFTSWNNNPARDWHAADANGSYGPIHRADMLQARMSAFKASGRKHTVHTMVEIMGDAAHVDLRGQEMLVHALDILETQNSDPGLSQINSLGTLQAIIAEFRGWIASGSRHWIDNHEGLGAYRRDRDNDGSYDARPAVILMDAWYNSMTDENSPLIPQVAALGGLALQGRYDSPGPIGSAFQNGWFQMIYGVLAQALEEQDGVERTPTQYRRLRCAGEGSSFTDCRDALLTTLNNALETLGGWDNHDSWDGSAIYNGSTVESHDQIQHTAISAGTVRGIHWQNRPTFQEAIQVKGIKPR